MILVSLLAYVVTGAYIIGDSKHHRVVQCASGSCTLRAGSAEGKDGDSDTLMKDLSLVELHGDDLVIADPDNKRIQVCPFGSPGSPCTTVDTGFEGGDDSLELDEPGHATKNSVGAYVICDTNHHRVLLCPPNETSCTQVAGTYKQSGNELYELNKPSAVALDSAGDYVIADTENDRVMKCPANSSLACTKVVWGLKKPSHVLVLASGEYLVTDTENHRILLCWAPVEAKSCSMVAGTGESGDGARELKKPWAVAIDDDGNYVIADSENDRIQVCNSNGTSDCTTVAGKDSNGDIVATELDKPRGILFLTNFTNASSNESLSLIATNNTTTTWTTTNTSTTLTTTTNTSTTLTTTTNTSTTSTTTNTSTTLTTTTNTTTTLTTTTNTSTTLTTTTTLSSTTNQSSTLTTTTNTSSTSNSCSHQLGPCIVTPNAGLQLTTTASQSRGTAAGINVTVTTTDEAPCGAADVVCSFGLHAILVIAMLATLCGSASCCVLLGTLWYWSRTRRRGKRYIPALQQRCKYRCEDRMENEVLKTHVMWEIDPKALSMFCGNDLGQRDLEGPDSLDEDGGHGHTLVARAQEHVDLELADVQAGTLGEFSSSLVSTGTSSSSVVQANSRLALRSGRHLSTVLHDVIPMGNLIPAYAHMSHVEYYSCTHHRWLPAVVTLDALDHHTHGTHRTEEVIYAVHLCRTQQFRNHVPLHHLRRPLAAGHLVEVLTGRGCAWQEARIQKLALGKTDRFYVVELQGQHITVPASSTRRRFPEGCEVLVYQGCTSGWQAGVVLGVVSGASWNPTSSESQSAFVVTRALKPHPGDAVTDFSFVPDSRVFAVEIAGKIHSSIPAHLLSIEVSDELP